MKEKRSLKPIVRWVVFALIAVGLAAVTMRVRQNKANNTARPDVKTEKAELADVRSTVSATGILQPFTLIDIKSKAGGKVTKMAVEEGTRIKKGQLICLIDREDTQASYDQSMADLRSAQAAEQQARQNLRLQNATIGPQISQAAESVSSARARLHQAQENLTLQSATVGPQIDQAAQAVASARARLAQAAEAVTLQEQTSQTAVDEAQSGIEAAQARLEQAQMQAQTQPQLSQAQVEQAQAGIEAAQAGVKSAQENLNLLKASTQPQELVSAQAQVDQAQSDVDTFTTNLKRLQGLLDKGFVAQTQVDAAQNQLVAARSSLKTAQSRLDTIKDAQTAQLREAQARVAQAQGSLNQANAALANARANTVQNTLKTKDVEAARATLRQAQTALVSAQANRKQVTLKRADVTAAQAATRQAEAALRSAQANRRTVPVKAADVTAADAAVRQAQAALRGAQANTIQSSVRAQDIAQAQARVVRAEVTARNARSNLEQTTVRAPLEGLVVKKYVDEGTIIQSGQSGFSGGTAIVQVADVTRMYVDTQVDEADIALIEEGQNVDITLDAYPNSPKSGKVRKVYPQATVEQNVTYIHVQVEINATDVDERLRSGMNATCDFLAEEKTNALSVPSEAIKDEGDESFVTVIKDPNKPLWEESNQEKRAVEVGVRGDERTEILKGLKAGETIVTQIIQPLTGSAPAGGTGSAPRGPTGGMGGGGGGRRSRF